MGISAKSPTNVQHDGQPTNVGATTRRVQRVGEQDMKPANKIVSSILKQRTAFRRKIATVPVETLTVSFYDLCRKNAPKWKIDLLLAEITARRP